MNIVRSEKLGKNFYLCSHTYTTSIKSGVRIGTPESLSIAEELFRQGVALVYQHNRTGTGYTHMYNPDQRLTNAEYMYLMRLPGKFITPQHIRVLCLQVPKGGATRPPLTPAQQSYRRKMRQVSGLQRKENEAAERIGTYPISGVQGRGAYYPSPFEQVCDANGSCKPDPDTRVAGGRSGRNSGPQPGRSGSRCGPDANAGADSDDDEKYNPVEEEEKNYGCILPLKCINGVCALSPEDRKCPPYNYPITVNKSDGTGSFTVQNLSTLRTTKKKIFDPYQLNFYDTCVPPIELYGGYWITDPQVRQYIGLELEPKYVSRQQWFTMLHEQAQQRVPSIDAEEEEDVPVDDDAENLQVKKLVMQDPWTRAPFFLWTNPEDGVETRVYMDPSEPVVSYDEVSYDEVLQLLEQPLEEAFEQPQDVDKFQGSQESYRASRRVSRPGTTRQRRRELTGPASGTRSRTKSRK